MPETDSQTLLVATLFQCVLALLGLFCLWRFVLRLTARRQLHTPAPLPAWDIPVSDFLTYVLGAICGAFVGMFAVGVLLGYFKVSTDARTILGTAGMQLGLLLVPLFLPLQLGRAASLRNELRRAFASGAVVFLLALPLIYVTTIGWTQLLEACGITLEKQEVMDLLHNSKSSALILVFVPMAAIVAPVSEELFFRGMLFRFMRASAPRWLALLIPAVLFGLSHFNLAAFLPLVVLALVFSFAYERTGRIGTTMVAHGLFNLHSIVLVLLGVGS